MYSETSEEIDEFGAGLNIVRWGKPELKGYTDPKLIHLLQPQEETQWELHGRQW